MPSPSAHLAVALLLLATSIEAPALAQSEADKATSDRLFEQGVTKMLAGSLDRGCPELAESQRLYPRPGTLFTLAECEAKAGKLVSALTHYQEYLRAFSEMNAAQQAQQRKKERNKISTAQIEALYRDIPQLTITAPTQAIAGLVVKLDGVPLDPSRIGLELPVDPGEHVVEWAPQAGAPGRQAITLALRARRTMTLAIGEAEQGNADKPAPTLAPATPGASGRRIAAYALGGLGVAGIALGAVAGGLVLSEKRTIEERCKETGSNDTWQCDAEGKKAADNAQDLFAPMSSIAFGVGAAALAAGIILLLTEPDAPGARAAAARVIPDLAIVPGGVSLGIRAAW